MLECVPVASARLLWARSAGCRGSSVLNYMPRAAGKMGARRVDGIARRLVPAICDVSVTNVCNATCDFCAYAHDKGVVRDRRWVDWARLAEALPILHRCGVRCVNFQGGEPLLHPAIDALIADVRADGMQPALITNGWLLPDKIERLAAAGLATLLV
jgi:molybdenum cofactor biosynthesis enzyme MoaA